MLRPLYCHRGHMIQDHRVQMIGAIRQEICLVFAVKLSSKNFKNILKAFPISPSSPKIMLQPRSFLIAAVQMDTRLKYRFFNLHHDQQKQIFNIHDRQRLRVVFKAYKNLSPLSSIIPTILCQKCTKTQKNRHTPKVRSGRLHRSS